MKKLYIILAVAFVAIAAGLIYYGNFSTPKDAQEVQERIKEDIKEKGIRSNKLIKPNLNRKMDKETIKKLIMIKQREHRENFNKQDTQAPEQVEKNVEKTAEPVKKPAETVKKPAEPAKKPEKK
ncbi:MAG TPA: hypothetical protein P5044_06435 [bacterium]|nr:hypothetical protein [bacterium]